MDDHQHLVAHAVMVARGFPARATESVVAAGAQGRAAPIALLQICRAHCLESFPSSTHLATCVVMMVHHAPTETRPSDTISPALSSSSSCSDRSMTAHALLHASESFNPTHLLSGVHPAPSLCPCPASRLLETWRASFRDPNRCGYRQSEPLNMGLTARIFRNNEQL